MTIGVERLTPEPGSLLHQLLEQYDDAKARAEEADDRLTAIKTGIKAELNRLRPAALRVEVTIDGLQQPLGMKWQPTTKFDTKRLKAEQPEVYQTYAYPDGHWEIRGVKP